MKRLLPGLLIVVATALAFGTVAFLRCTHPAGQGAIPRIDAHTHLGPGVLPEGLGLFERAGIKRVVNLSGGAPGRGLETQLEAAEQSGGRVIVFTNIDFRGFGQPGWTERTVADLERARALGARGLKISKALGLWVQDPSGALVLPDDARLDPVFEAAGRLGMPISIHTGDPKAFFEAPTPANERWEELSLNPGWSFHGPPYPDWETLFTAFSARVERSPDTTFVGVHFGNAPEDPARVGALMDRLPNLWIDTAARVGELGRDDVPGRREATRQVILDHRTRVLFGTDTSLGRDGLILGAPGNEPHDAHDAERFFGLHWAFFETATQAMAHPTPIQGRWTVSGLKLPRPVLEDLYHRNAERLLGLEPLE